MKKIIALLISSAASPFIAASSVFAQGGNIGITAPAQGFKTIGNFITNILIIAFGIGVLVVLIMLIWGAFEWITSGGDKEHVASARNRILNALIGLAVLAITFALARVAAGFLGFDLQNISIPAPVTTAPPSGLY